MKPIKKVVSDDEMPTYPDGIGDYKDNRIVIAGDRNFECIEGKKELCNNVSYASTGDQSYVAWSDVTTDITHLYSKDIKANSKKPSGVEYVYPNGIESYSAGTTVAIGQDVYRCKVGPESSLCIKEAYEPSGKFGSDAWTKVQ
jgi:hypothetical protein